MAQSGHGTAAGGFPLSEVGSDRMAQEAETSGTGLNQHIEPCSLTVTLALGNLLAQIRQPNITSVAAIRILFSVLACSPTFFAR